MQFTKWFGLGKNYNGKEKQAESSNEIEVNEDKLDENQILENIQSDDDNDTDVIKIKSNNNLIDFYPNYLDLEEDQIYELVEQYQIIKYEQYENKRSSIAYKKGGIACADDAIIKKYRSVAKEILKQIGKKLLTGNFNLTTISFPIKAMISKSNLEQCINGTSLFPLLINKASQSSDPVERFKLTISTILCSYLYTNQFFKPLNPILGETLQAEYKDGSQIYAEQISHHPPISYFLLIGPNNAYRYSGYYNVEAKAGLNSLQIINKGKRQIIFNTHQQQQTISFDFPNDVFSGTFFGTTKLETLNKIIFTDTQNSLYCQVQFGKLKGLPSDYFQADLLKNNQVISKLHGTYLGYIDFDTQRYWQYDSQMPFRVQMKSERLPSDHLNRPDLIQLRLENLKKAQIEKDNLEQMQRTDAKLRKNYQKNQKK